MKWICIKCGKEQDRRVQGECPYVGKKAEALLDHSYVDKGEFIQKLREKLPPFIRERVADVRKKYAEKQALYNERMGAYNKKLNELKTAYNGYLNGELRHFLEDKKQRRTEEIQRSIEKEKQSAKRKLLFPVIGLAAGVFIAFKWILPIFGETTASEIIGISIGFLVLSFFILREPVSDFLLAKRIAESSEPNDTLADEADKKLADKLAAEWRENNGLNKLESDLKDEQWKWEQATWNFERFIENAEDALTGNSNDLLYFYNSDMKTKRWYVEEIFDGEW